MEQDQTKYKSYLLRLWQEKPGRDRRAMLQDVLSGERHSFATLESLLAFLGEIEMEDKGENR